MRDPERSASAMEASPEEEFSYLLSEASDRLQAGRLEEARSHLERALSLRPGHEQARNLLGLCLFRTGQLDDALALFQDLVDDNPVEPSLRLNLAMVQLKAGHLAEARTELERVLDLNPGHVRAASYMGLVLERLSRFGESAAWYEQAGQNERAREMRARQAEFEANDDEKDEVDIDLGSLDGAPAPPPADEVPAPPPLEEELAESEVQAAALSALRAEALRRPLAMPTPVELDEAEQVKLGFTLEVGAGDPPRGAPLDAPDEVGFELDADLGPGLDDETAGAMARPPAAAPPARTDAPRAKGRGEDRRDKERRVEERRVEDRRVEEESDDEGPAAEHVVLDRDEGDASGEGALSRHEEVPPPPPAPPEAPPLGEAAHGRFRGPLSLSDLVVTRRVDARRAEAPSASLGGLLLFPVADVAYLRTDLLVSLAGDFEVEPLNRRYRGRRTDSLFGGNQAPMVAALGEGLSWLDPGEREVTLLRLENEELYLVEAAVLAFSSGLVWENGRLPDERGRDLDIVHLRGTGVIVLGTERPTFCLEVRPERPVTLHAERLIGWNGSVVPSRGPLPGLPESANRPPIVRFEGTGQVLGI